MILFLGAGASKPFGIPTMTEFVKEFEKELEDSDSKYKGTPNEISLYQNIKEFMGSNVDLEAILSTLNVLSEDLNPEKLGLRVVYYADYQRRESSVCSQPRDYFFSPNEDAKHLVEKLENFVKEKCSKPEMDEVMKVYNNFFTTFRGVISGFNMVAGKDIPAPAINIFTTNYDRCIERYCRKIGTEINRGFKPDMSSGRSILDTHGVNNSKFYQSDRENYIGLFKLHGSIDWRILGDVVFESTIEGDSTIDDEKIEGELMIYPVQEKYIYKDPFYYMFYFLKRELEKTNIFFALLHN